MADSIGIDIVDLSRVARLYEKYGERFLGHILSPGEIELCNRRSDKVAFLAGRFACKEAVIKALAPYLGTRPSFSSITIRNETGGRPEVHFGQPLDKKLEPLSFRVSISHDRTSAVAMAVIIESRSTPR
jgi:holo-[acyl-carrier protein] synthase